MRGLQTPESSEPALTAEAKHVHVLMSLFLLLRERLAQAVAQLLSKTEQQWGQEIRPSQ